MSSFSDLGVPARLVDVLTTLDIHAPTPIQHATLPDALAGRDVLGRGRTGSGKTLAFLLPTVARLATGRVTPRAGAPRALILGPTRELATQIDTALRPLATAAGLTSRTVFGGVAQNPQVAALRRGIDIVIACPGRLEDLIAQGHCSLARTQITVLDEADHMAELGFLPAVRRLLDRTPAHGQRMLFSATLDRAVDTLVRRYLSDPVHEADSVQSPVGTMTHHVVQVEREHRLAVLVELTSPPGRTVVFTRTKRSATTLARQLSGAGVAAVELHGNLSQNARTRNLEQFHAGRASTLVATYIAERGIHVDDVTLVVHADPPADHKAYLHRSGRTARAGNSGTVITLASAEQRREVAQLAAAAGITATTRLATGHHPPLTASAPASRLLAPPAPGPGAAAKDAAKDEAKDLVTITTPAGRHRARRRPAHSRHAGQPRSRARRAPEAPTSVPARVSTAGSAASTDQQMSHSAAAFSARRR